MIKRNPSAKSIDRVEYREGIRFENDYLLDELVVVVAAGGTCGKKKKREEKKEKTMRSLNARETARKLLRNGSSAFYRAGNASRRGGGFQFTRTRETLVKLVQSRNERVPTRCVTHRETMHQRCFNAHDLTLRTLGVYSHSCLIYMREYKER